MEAMLTNANGTLQYRLYGMGAGGTSIVFKNVKSLNVWLIFFKIHFVLHICKPHVVGNFVCSISPWCVFSFYCRVDRLSVLHAPLFTRFYTIVICPFFARLHVSTDNKSSSCM
jgi:hypothetical protein